MDKLTTKEYINPFGNKKKKRLTGSGRKNTIGLERM